MSDEYPKAIEVDGVPLTVTSAEDEARWRAVAAPVAAVEPEPVAEPEPEPESAPEPAADPLDDVTVEMDNPDFDPPKSKKTAAKKK